MSLGALGALPTPTNRPSSPTTSRLVYGHTPRPEDTILTFPTIHPDYTRVTGPLFTVCRTPRPFVEDHTMEV